ncbi:CoA pyrophosphatase [Oscillochloris sp. ZM17-4]|uniref:NUDIX hydrolase n=1 Tax=Oscillochloris sp. ZM17-4 TaxID=2866714 RepID=UPI001C73DA38|nr:CoA pyrophosphatase [Oscillochloris sp. ZM17-4]MBX0326934.1 CoA pyrophosphatase [Oscillochloris sp. ZM17-4]
MSTEPWRSQADRVRRAMAAGGAVTFEELLLVRDIEGRLARQLEPPPDAVPRPAAVLLLLYPQAGELHLPLTVRAGHLPTHKGQVALPGGSTDPEDDGPAATALREAEEELGIPPASVEVLGALSSFYIPPSGFMITPVVGLSAAAPELRPHPGEVELAFSVPLSQLLDPATVVTEEWELRGMKMQVPFFALGGQKVWGATAIVLSEFVARIRRAG